MGSPEQSYSQSSTVQKRVSESPGGRVSPIYDFRSDTVLDVGVGGPGETRVGEGEGGSEVRPLCP